MKKTIHPKYNPTAAVICACGHTFTVGSTENEIKTELCSVCHPFYTGKQKLVDTARRVEKFKNKVEASTTKKAAGLVSKKVKRATRTAARDSK